LPVTSASTTKVSGDIGSLENALHAGGKRNKSVAASTAIAAFALFVALNGFFWGKFGDDAKVKGNASDSNRDLWSGAGSIDITVNGFKALKTAPTVVLLGSSLIMHPFWSMDSELGDVGDIFHHHESYRMAHDLSTAGVDKPVVYSLAVFGEMISDAYIYVNDFLKGDKKPKLVVFGIAPRDFNDADLPAPTASFTFKRLVGLKNIGRYASDYMPGWSDQADFALNHTCFLYGKRWRLQHEISKGMNKSLGVVGLNQEEPVKTDAHSAHAGFMLGGTRQERFEISTREYTRRYQGIGEKDLSLQMGFLSKIFQTCQSRGIKLIVVNMPLTPVNRALMPVGFYDRYREQVSSLVKQYGTNTKLIDLGQSPIFKDHDYWDTAHLNNLGGHKLLGQIESPVIDSLR
jgi:hypothetical protein